MTAMSASSAPSKWRNSCATHAIATRHPFEFVVFTDEEGGTVGSQAMAGRLPASAFEVVSHSGLTIGDGIRAVGGDPARIAEARRAPGSLAAFVELHIEQGAILAESGIDIGVVEGIVGIRWWDVTVEGVANHAGTTPMGRRRDALVSAAELTLAVNRIASTTPGTQVATVGRISAEPGAPNVIPGRVTLSLEIRDLDAGKMAIRIPGGRGRGEAHRRFTRHVDPLRRGRTRAHAGADRRTPARDRRVCGSVTRDCRTGACRAAPATTPRTWRTSRRWA